jgi:anthranilate phosphoribosyltransferase
MLSDLTQQLRQGRNLSPEQIAAAVHSLASPDVTPETKAEFLIALKDKGESPDELAGFAKEFRKLSLAVSIDDATRARGIVDVCGTGGDKLNTFNISSTVAILVSAAGLTVAKHGGRAVTSACGSAEVLETLGIKINLSPADAAASLREHNFAFFFAPNYHPAFANIAPARKLASAQGHRTLFNLMGPLLNPARPDFQLVGVPRPEFCEPIATVLKQLGSRRAIIASGAAGDGHLDELSVIAPSSIATFDLGSEVRVSSIDPTSFGLAFTSLDQLRGGNREENAQITRDVLENRDRGPKRDAVLLNAGAAIHIGGRAKDIAEGIQIARETIDSGAAAAKLRALSSL